MKEPIEKEYFNWLCAKVLGVNNSPRVLLEILHEVEFVWVVPGDRHRLEDGLELRRDFIRETGLDEETLVTERACSIFEMLIAFAQRASWQTDGPVPDWFWQFIVNLRLDHFARIRRSERQTIEEILNIFIWRLYEPSGFGGMFPLSETHNDQRQVEIWYQFCEYLDDRGLF